MSGNEKQIKLSEYAAFAKLYIESDIKYIKKNGSYYVSTNNTTYTSVDQYVNDIIVQMVLESQRDVMENDISVLDAIRMCGILKYIDRRKEWGSE